jgi:hypothetical protein
MKSESTRARARGNMKAPGVGISPRARPKWVRRRKRAEIVSDALVRRILKLMEDQSMTVSQAAEAVGASYVSAWRRLQEPQFAKAYLRARVLAADGLVQQAEDALNPPCDGASLAPHQVTLRIARAKQCLWLAGKLDPMYGPRSTITHEGSKENPVEHNVVLSPGEAYQRMLGG